MQEPAIRGAICPRIVFLFSSFGDSLDKELDYLDSLVKGVGLDGVPYSYGVFSSGNSEIIQQLEKIGPCAVLTFGDAILGEGSVKGVVTKCCPDFPSEIENNDVVLRTMLRELLEIKEIVENYERPTNYNFLLTLDKIKEFLSWANQHKLWSIDIESTPFPPYHKNFKLVSVSFTHQKDSAYAFGLHHPQSAFNVDKDSPEYGFTSEVWYQFLDFLQDPSIHWIGHNILKFDKPGLELPLGIRMTKDYDDFVNRFDDTMIMKYTLNEACKGKYKLKICAKEELGWKNWGIDTKDLMKEPLESVLKYNCQDTDATFQLYHVFLRKFKDHSPHYHVNLHRLYKEVHFPTSVNAAILSRNGIKANMEYATKYRDQHYRKLKLLSKHVLSDPEVVAMEKEKREEIIKKRKKFPIKGTPTYDRFVEKLMKESAFNVNSTIHIKTLLYSRFKLSYPEHFGRTEKKREEKVTEDSLRWHAKEFQKRKETRLSRLCNCLCRIQLLQKDLSNFILPVISNASKTVDGLSHCSFSLVRVETGRYGCTNADDVTGTKAECGENLQKVDKRPEIRNCYKSRFED